ncbi:MAG TPA: ATP-binding protein [Acidimicrobiales bacterium]|nr:ATP-binding protein [Acidimicrobiales bacterium]
MEAQRRASVELPAATTAPRDARRFTARTLRDWGADHATEEAELIVSELVTNAFRHADSPSRLALSMNGECLRIEVVDHGSGGAVRRHARPDDVGGRGLLLVEIMADRWGARRDGQEHVVWCEIAL